MKCSSVLSLLAFVSILHLTVPSPAVISTGNYIDLLSTMFKQLHDWNTQQGLHKGTNSRAFRTYCLSEVTGSGDTLTGSGQWYAKFYCAGMSVVAEMSSHDMKLAVYSSAHQFIERSMARGQLEHQDLEDTLVSLLTVGKEK